jgi:hypothetical protein
MQFYAKSGASYIHLEVFSYDDVSELVYMFSR